MRDFQFHFYLNIHFHYSRYNVSNLRENTLRFFISSKEDLVKSIQNRVAGKTTLHIELDRLFEESLKRGPGAE